MSHICFVTDELYPATKGGAGALLFNSGIALAGRGHKISFLLDVSAEDYRRAQDFFLGGQSPFPVEGLGHVAQLCEGVSLPSEAEVGGWYAWKSYCIYTALSRFSQQHRFDGIEFNDYFGPAYYSLVAKASGFYFHKTPLVVRVHNSWEVLAQAGDSPVTEAYVLLIQALERASMRLAEHLLVPSEAYWDATSRFYPAPFGDAIVCKPALFKWPEPIAAPGTDSADKILFFGRLQPFKGLDRLVSALVTLAYQRPESSFLLVGSDSTFTHDGVGSYREQLLRFVPPELHSRFEFTGPLTFEQLGRRLPEVRFAVFPNYYESFCYAAHELYEAGVPLILSRTPVFVGAFEHERSALIFDGGIDDLIRQMDRLWSDAELRRKIQRPFEVKQDPLPTFYGDTPKGYLEGPPVSVDVTVLILEDGKGDARRTFQTVGPQLREADNCAILAGEASHPGHIPIRFLGERFYLTRPDGRPLTPDEFRTRNTTILIQAGDELDPEALSYLRGVLASQPLIAYAHCWRDVRDGHGNTARQCLALELNEENMLFTEQPFVSRTLLRTPPDSRVDDIFDIRAGRLGEIDYLWRLSGRGSGVTVPKVLMSCSGHGTFLPIKRFPSVCTYMVFKERDSDRLHRMACMTLLGSSQPAISEIMQNTEVGNTERIALSMLPREQMLCYARQRLRVKDLLGAATSRFFAILLGRIKAAVGIR